MTQAFKSSEIDADPNMVGGSGTGILSLSFTGWTAVTGIVVQSNGKIDLAVTTSSGGMNVAQLNSDGSTDTSFGPSGIETLSSLPAARGMVLAPNGDLLVAGLSGALFKVAELNPSTGSPDTSYNTSGTASIVANFIGSTVTYIGMALRPGGDLLLAGTYTGPGPGRLPLSYLGMVAITPTGHGDSSFGTSGVYDQGWGSGYAPGDAPLAVSPTGQILIGYASAHLGNLFLAVYEFNPNGSLKNSFGTSGIARGNLSSGSTNIVLSIETNGQIVIGDGSGSGTFNLVRFNADGTLDTTFGSSGVESGASESGGLAMTTASNGETVMVGTPSSGSGIILQEFHTLANAQRVYVEQDADYNVTSITDTSGNVVERYEYDPYGSVTVLNPDGTVRGDGTAASSFYVSVYLHQGLRLDVAVGAYDNRNRFLNPLLGRFLQQDPSRYVNGPDIYQYKLSSPLVGADPTGKALQVLLILEYQSASDAAEEFGVILADSVAEVIVVGSSVVIVIGVAGTAGYYAGNYLGTHDATGEFFGWLYGVVIYGGTSQPPIPKPGHSRPSGGHSQCFPAGTLVNTPKGKVAIEGIKIGDKVLSFDTRDQRVISTTVTKTVVTKRNDLVELITGNGKLLVSVNHCFYSASHDLAFASELCTQRRDLLVLGENNQVMIRGASSYQAKVATQAAPIELYNLGLDICANYFVGNDSFLVEASD